MQMRVLKFEEREQLKWKWKELAAVWGVAMRECCAPMVLGGRSSCSAVERESVRNLVAFESKSKSQ